MSLAKSIEYRVTNGLGYEPLKTDFIRGNPRTYFKQPLEESDIRNSKHAVRAHLEHLAQNEVRMRAISLFNLLRNSPKEHLFEKNDGRYITLDDKLRRRIRKDFVRRIKSHKKIMNNEISSAQFDARISVLKSGKDFGRLLIGYSSYLSHQEQ